MKKLTIQEVIDYIRTWEIEEGESFMDYAGDDLIFLNVSFLLGYWSVECPKLYHYLMTESKDTIPWKYPQDGLLKLAESFYMPSWNEHDYQLSLVPWISLIVDNDIYYKRFINWKNQQNNET